MDSLGQAASSIPKPLLIGGAIAVVLVLFVLMRRSGGTVTAVAQQAPIPEDPAIAAANASNVQAAYGARTSAFSALADVVGGVSSTLIGATRDVSLGALAGNASVANSYFAANRDVLTAGLQEQGATARAQLAESGATTRTGLMETGLTMRAGIDSATYEFVAQEGTRQMAQNNATQEYLAGVQSRTVLGVNNVNNGTQRRKNEYDAVNAGAKTVCNGIVRFFTLGLAGC